MPVNREQMHMEQNQTVDNEVYTVGDMVYYTGTGKTFENGDWIQYGSQGKVEGPVNGEELQGEGVAVLFSGNTCMDDCLLTQARRLPPPTTPRCPS